MEHKGNAAFVFMWKIKNLWRSQDRTIPSPKFMVEALNKTEWHLELDPGTHYADEHMCCHLLRDDDNAPEIIDLEFEISLTHDGENSTKNVRESRFSFKKGDNFSCEEFALRDCVFQNNHATFTLHCRMWAHELEFLEVAQCSARTLMAQKKIIDFTWTVEGICSIPFGPSKTLSLASTPGGEGPSMTLEMILGNGKYRVKGFKATVKGIDNENVHLLTFEIVALDSKGQQVLYECHNYPIMEGISDYEWHVSFYIKKNDLTVNSPGEVLTLIWKCKNTVIDVNEIQYPQRRSFKTRIV